MGGFRNTNFTYFWGRGCHGAAHTFWLPHERLSSVFQRNKLWGVGKLGCLGVITVSTVHQVALSSLQQRKGPFDKHGQACDGSTEDEDCGWQQSRRSQKYFFPSKRGRLTKKSGNNSHLLLILHILALVNLAQLFKLTLICRPNVFTWPVCGSSFGPEHAHRNQTSSKSPGLSSKSYKENWFYKTSLADYKNRIRFYEYHIVLIY